MKKMLLLMSLLMAGAAANAAVYQCKVYNPQFHSVMDLKTSEATLIVPTTNAYIEGVKVVSAMLSDGRKASVSIFNYDDPWYHFQLQLYENGKDFLTFIAATVKGLQKQVWASGQRFDPKTKLWDEYHLECVKQ